MKPKEQEIRRLLGEGQTRREVARLVRASPMTVRAIADTVKLPPCPCGKRHGHKGWCPYRLARSPRRQAFLPQLAERNRGESRPRGYTRTAEDRARKSDAHVGVPKKADAETIAECKAQPLPVRRWYRRTRLALAGACSLDRRFNEGDPETVADLLLVSLIQPEPTPLDRLIEKEEHQEWEREQRRFWLWRHDRPPALNHIGVPI